MAAAPPAEVDGRTTNLDILRALAALYVLAGHAYLLSGTAIAFTDRDPFRLLINTGGAGVWLFFALSGYLIAGPWVRSLLSGDELPGARPYARRRATRILPAYWLAFATVLAFGLAPGTPLSLGQVAVHWVLLHNLVPGEEQALYFASWTLSLEVLFYALVPAVAWTSRRLHPGPITLRAIGRGVGAVWVLSIAYVAVAAQVDDPATGVWLRTLLPALLSMFCPGIAIAAVVHAHRAGQHVRWFARVVEHRRASVAAVVLLSIAGAFGATSQNLQVYSAARQLFAVASGIGLALALTRPAVRGRGGQVLEWLGMVSYGIYLWQGVVIYLLLRHPGVIPLPHPGGLAYVVHVAVLAGLTVPAAWVSWELIERPALRWGHRRATARARGGTELAARPDPSAPDGLAPAGAD